jgi:NAD(P)H-hydrate epimerase
MVVPGDELSAVSPEGYQALLVGPGWGRDPSRFALLRELVQSGLPGVLDADGLNLLADAEARGEALPDFGGQWVLTPHPGECARIAGVPVSQVMREPLKTIIGLSERLNAVCVLKSHVSYLSQPDGFYAFLDGANAALATGGGGDVLSGIVAGLLAQGAGPWDAACAALLAHSRAGMLLRTRAGWFVAEELIDATGEVLGRAALGSDRWDAVGAPGRNRGAGQTDGARGAYRSFGRNGGAGRNDGPGEAESNRDWGGSASE